MLAVGAAVHKQQPVSAQGHRKAGEECLVVLGYPVSGPVVGAMAPPFRELGGWRADSKSRRGPLLSSRLEVVLKLPSGGLLKLEHVVGKQIILDRGFDVVGIQISVLHHPM